MNTLKSLSSQSLSTIKNLGYAGVIALLFASCGDDKKDTTEKFDKSKPIYVGDLIGHGGKGSRNLPIYNQIGEFIDYNIGDTGQVIYDNGKLEVLDLKGGENNGYQVARDSSYSTQFDYAQTIEDVIITEKLTQYEPVNTPTK